MSLFSRKPDRVPEAAEALPGRDHPSFDVPAEHDVLAGKPLVPPFPDGIDWLLVGMGCFWGAERMFWQTPGVCTTAVGYAGGDDAEPDLPRGLHRPDRPCRGRAGRLRPVRDLATRSCCKFWEGHDPTQGMRQGNDTGTQYRSAIYCGRRSSATPPSPRATRTSGARRRGLGPITTEIAEGRHFYYAEDYHQQYLHKNPAGYCGIGGTGVSCPIGAGVNAA